MNIVINPDSHHTGGSFAVALARAEDWLQIMRGEGIVDVDLLDGAGPCNVGWTFSFRHNITGKVCQYETHGLFNLRDSYKDHGFVFCPRTYWNGSSCSDPKVEDFLTEGFVVVHKIEALTP